MFRFPKIGRLSLRLELQLVDDMKDYAKRHGTSLTALVSTYFNQLLLKEAQSKESSEPEQI